MTLRSRVATRGSRPVFVLARAWNPGGRACSLVLGFLGSRPARALDGGACGGLLAGFEPEIRSGSDRCRRSRRCQRSRLLAAVRNETDVPRHLRPVSRDITSAERGGFEPPMD